jgi:hypothetical protein
VKIRMLVRLFCLLLAVGPLFSEMVVRTKDGRVFKVAVEGSEVASIEFTSSTGTSVPSAANNVEGLWDTTIPGSVHVQVEFRRAGAGWTGRFLGFKGWETMADLVVDVNRGTISWRRPLAWAGESDQRYTAKVTGNSMTGVFLPSTNWTGTRAR